MNSPARRWVNAIPDASSRRSISPCMRAKRKGGSISGMIPESLTTWPTPALRAASMKLDWTSSTAGSEEEMSIARSVHPVQGPGERVGPRHVALHDLDLGEGRQPLGLDEAAHQRAGGHPSRRQPLQQRASIQPAGPGHQDHRPLLLGPSPRPLAML
jgi:hypothetical protein